MDPTAAPAQRVGTSPNPTARSLPRDGDVVIVRESRSVAKYLVRQLPGVVQFHVRNKDEAIQLARGFAQRAAVDLWCGEESICTLLETYRRQGP